MVGMLFFRIGHGTLHWAEQWVPSGISALLVATEPLWIALFFSPGSGVSRLRAQTLAGLLLGLLGVWTVLGGTPDEAVTPTVGTVAILIGAASSERRCRLQSARRHAGRPDVAHRDDAPVRRVRASGGAVLARRRIARVSHRLRLDRGVHGHYWLLDRYPATLVSTHTYVNPAVAVLLGWAIGDERVSATLFAGLALIAASIWLVGNGAPSEGRPAPNTGRVTTEVAPRLDGGDSS